MEAVNIVLKVRPIECYLLYHHARRQLNTTQVYAPVVWMRPWLVKGFYAAMPAEKMLRLTGIEPVFQ